MHTHIDLQCAPGRFVEVHLDESLRATEAKERIEAALIDQQAGRLMPTTKGFMYYPPDERWDEQRMVVRLHQLLIDLFGGDHSVSFRRGGNRVRRLANGDEYLNEPVLT